jgi:23S rRNA pseudouridine2604 synthase
MDISLNKYISDSGFCSRREADKYIEECRVTINGKDAHKGNRVQEGDDVRIDGEPLRKKKTAVYILLNKPKGVTCTTDTTDKSNIISFMNYKTRIFPIGRLDKLSEGLIFLTNDGDIVNKSFVPATGMKKNMLLR